MHLHLSFDLAADAATVARMLADPAYVHAKVLASGALDQQVDVVGSDAAAFTVTTRRSLPTDQIPANFRPLVGSQLDVRQVEAWEAAAADHSRRGTVVVEITGAPVRLTGTASLTPAGDHTTLVYDGDVKSSIPLFAASVEQAAAGAIRAGLTAEGVVAARWLEGHGTADRP